MPSDSDSNHPYEKFEGSPLWKALDKGIADLEENRDLEITTAREYVLGYLCKKLTRSRSVSKVEIPSPKPR